MKCSESKSITNKLLQSFNYNQIILKRSLGKGAFGQCFEIDWKENSIKDTIKMALKFIPGGIYDSKKDLFNREISIHQKMCNKYIVQLHKVNIDPLSGDVYMIMELCFNRSLADYINQNGPSCFKAAHMNRVCNGISRGLIYLHQDQGIVHRDIKPANILLNEKMSPKISDFGLATTPEQCQQTKQKICGTPHYLAPEIFQQCGHSYQSDIWVFGVTLYFMIAGFTPFETQRQRDGTNKSNSLQQTITLVYQNVVRGKYRFPKCTPLCNKRFIKSILQKDPKLRRTHIFNAVNEANMRQIRADNPMVGSPGDLIENQYSIPDNLLDVVCCIQTYCLPTMGQHVSKMKKKMAQPLKRVFSKKLRITNDPQTRQMIMDTKRLQCYISDHKRSTSPELMAKMSHKPSAGNMDFKSKSIENLLLANNDFEDLMNFSKFNPRYSNNKDPKKTLSIQSSLSECCLHLGEIGDTIEKVKRSSLGPHILIVLTKMKGNLEVASITIASITMNLAIYSLETKRFEIPRIEDPVRTLYLVIDMSEDEANRDDHVFRASLKNKYNVAFLVK